MAADDKIIHFNGLIDLLKHEIGCEVSDLDMNCKNIFKAITEIRKELKTCDSLDKHFELLSRSQHYLAIFKNVVEKNEPLKHISNDNGYLQLKK